MLLKKEKKKKKIFLPSSLIDGSSVSMTSRWIEMVRAEQSYGCKLRKFGHSRRALVRTDSICNYIVGRGTRGQDIVLEAC